MALKRKRSKKNLCKLEIDEGMTISIIDELKQGLSEVIDLYDDFELKLTSVEAIDSSGIQLLLAFKKEINLKNKVLKLTAVSSVVAKQMEDYGVSNLFGIGDAV